MRFIETDKLGFRFLVTVNEETKRKRVKALGRPLYGGGRTLDFGIRSFKRVVRNDPAVPKKQQLIDQYKAKAWGIARDKMAEQA